MGKAARFACILTPMLLTLGALICLLLVFFGTQSKSALLPNAYFFKIDWTNFTSATADRLSSLDVPGVPDEKLWEVLNLAKEAQHVEDVYTIGLWSYCEGPAPQQGDNFKPADCSPRSRSFYFNPLTVWNINSTDADLIPKSLTSSLNAYRVASRWNIIVHTFSISTIAVALVVGLSGIWSRWGSFVTTVIIVAGAISTIAGAITVTALYGAISSALNTAFKVYGIKTSLGSSGIAIEWLAALFASAACAFWLLSSCCCSGSSNNPYRSRNDPHPVHSPFSNASARAAEKSPSSYSYQPVASPNSVPYPAAGQQQQQPSGSYWPQSSYDQHQHHDIPLQPMNQHQSTAYEPYRNV